MKVNDRTLTASEGHYLTDGKNYGKTFHLGEDRSPDEFYEITDAEYSALLAKQREEEYAAVIGGEKNGD